MIPSSIRQFIERLDIHIDGPGPIDPHVHDVRVYQRILSGGSLALGESYMDGWWDVERLDAFFERLAERGVIEDFLAPRLILQALWARMSNPQSRRRAWQVGREHYDKGNELYEAMLDKQMIYSCAYWKDAQTLEEAQEAKLDLVCRKLNLKSGQHILDIGSGWGGFAQFAAKKYGVHVTGITVSKEQVLYAEERVGSLPIIYKLQDYRDLGDEQYDHIVSIGMFEHVGPHNYHTFMETVHRCLKDDGLFLLHTIGNNRTVLAPDPWMNKYIFPNGILPSIRQIGTAIEKRFVMEDWHNFGADYDKTLMEWFRRFDIAWPQLRGNKYDDRFYRMWKYYLLSVAGVFRARKMQLWQIVLSKKGVRGGYVRVR